MDSFPELKTLFLSESMSDIILIVDGFKIPAHKLVLSAKSEVFKAMFCGVDMIESTAKEVEIKETSFEPFVLMLKFVYTESFQLEKENDYEMAIDVFKIAHRFRFERLVVAIRKLLIDMVTKGIDGNKSRFTKRSPEEWISKEINDLMLDSFCEATIENIAVIYQFATLYEINDLMIACHRFLLEPKNALVIISKRSFLCESSETMFDLMEIMGRNVSQTVVIKGLKAIHESNPDLDMKSFESLIYLNECSVENISDLRSIKILSDDMLFDALITKCNKINRDNEVKAMKIMELSSANQALNDENQDLLLKKNALYENYFRLKQVFAPFMRGENNLWVNEYNYSRNFSRTRLKSTTNVKFNF